MNELVSSEQNPQDPKVRAVQLLAVGQKPAWVARELGIGRTTLYQWRLDPAFRAALATARRELWQDTLNQLRCLAGKALATLAAGLESGDERIRLQTALKVLEMAMTAALPPVENGDGCAVVPRQEVIK